ncbi:MAG: hypothetical protein KAR42_07465 [candidate division Zixibacteria bacterium]|nr:hypothetical protein [candidate division Zixibacteria bacterium]
MRFTIFILFAISISQIFFVGDSLGSDESELAQVADLRASVFKDGDSDFTATFSICSYKFNKNRKFLSPVFSMVSIVQYNEEGARYSFKGIMQFVSLGLTAAANELVLGGHGDAFTSDARYLFFLPYSSHHIDLSEDMMLTLGVDSDYLFYRHKTGDRGILYSPYIGLTYTSMSKYSTVKASGFTLYFGHQRFLNFDGSDKNLGVVIGISLFGDGSLLH